MEAEAVPREVRVSFKLSASFKSSRSNSRESRSASFADPRFGKSLEERSDSYERETLYYDGRKRPTSPPCPLPSVERTSFFFDLLSPSGLQLPSDETETEASKGSSSELSMGGSTRNERTGKELTGRSVMRPPALKRKDQPSLFLHF